MTQFMHQHIIHTMHRRFHQFRIDRHHPRRRAASPAFFHPPNLDGRALSAISLNIREEILNPTLNDLPRVSLLPTQHQRFHRGRSLWILGFNSEKLANQPHPFNFALLNFQSVLSAQIKMGLTADVLPQGL